MRRRYLRAITIVIAVCGLVGFGLLWQVGSNFHLQHLSRELLAGKSTEQAIAFVDVNLVPIDSERIVPQQTVIVHDGRIAGIGAAGTLPFPPTPCGSMGAASTSCRAWPICTRTS